ncbi:MAG TPA: immunoglobulin domain-containing protein, partial [Candidatus Acidoferrales bacterium]|nr:immunoglobulin domain-containing protein [Candidatus Acidoferrales bacterium]
QGANLFYPPNAATEAGNATSAGAHSPVTIPVLDYGANSGTTAQLAPPGTYPTQAATARTNVALMLFSEEALVNGASPGVGSAANPQGLMILSNVPAGIYDLYLYGANSDGTRGAAFVVDSGTPTNGIYETMNPYATPGTETNFVLGVDFTVYNNVTPNADSTIHIMWGAVSNINSSLTGEGDFNGLQLVPSHAVQAGAAIIQPPVNAIFAQGTTATLPAQARGNPAVAYQWYSGSPPGTPVAGQTSGTLTFANALASQSGNYFFVATNLYGAVTSSVVTLTIASAPVIVGQATTTSSNAVILYSGHNHFGLSVTAYGDSSQPLYYYWQSNGVTTAVTTNAGTGETNGFTWVNTTASATYSCVLSNSYGKATGNSLGVSIVAAPVSPYANALLGLSPFAYWPLNETSGTITYDYVSGNNGMPTAGSAPNGQTYIMGQPGPIAGFGASSLSYEFPGLSAVDVPGTNLNFSGPITLITWVTAQYPTANGFETLVGKGDKSYRIDIDANALSHFNDDSGAEAVGGPFMESGAWHQVVGTFTGSNINLYVDGVPVATGGDTSTPGDNLDFWIGGAPDYGTGRDLGGSLAQVAIFTNALSAAQVLALFQAGETPPDISEEPTNVSGFVDGDAEFSVAASGGTPLSYQWTGPAGVIAGATNATLLLSNLTVNTPANNGPGLYYCTITNPYGSTNTESSGGGNLTVSIGSPNFIQDLPPIVYGIVGSPLVLSVVEGGNQPITNQWYYGAGSPPTTAVRNGGRIGGATSATLTITNAQMSDQGYYQVLATNNIAPYSASSQIAQVIIEPEPLFNSDGAGWTINGTVATINNNLLTLTAGANGEISSFFYDTPVYVAAFAASFTYTATNSPNVASTTSLADGTTFCIQNSPEGTAAIGAGGGALAYEGITESAALAIDLYNANPGGIQFVSGGANPSGGQYTLSTPVVLTTGHPVNVSLHYNGETLAVKMADTLIATNIFMTNIVIGPISQYVGSDIALIGFTAATGGVNSVQTIKNFAYTPLPTLAAAQHGTNVVVSWPVGVGGYSLQETPSLTTPNWTTIAGPYNAVGSNLEVPVPIASGNQFFRLEIQ